jgi:hypothetical protein
MPAAFPAEPVRLIEDEATGDRFLIYSTERGISVELRYEGDTLWLSEAQIAEMFGVSRQNVNTHLNNIYSEGELERSATCKENLQVRREGNREVTRKAFLHNLDAIISVGYRVGGKQGTMFRIWATDKLVQFATKGFVIDVERLKRPEDQDRVAEIRQILQDIRSDEANIYREVRAICATCRDYDPKSTHWREFYGRIQAKIVYAVTSKTPSMIVMERADAAAPNMGLQTWPKDRIRQEDVTTSKNYLAHGEIEELNRLSSLLLDYLLDQVKLKRIAIMAEAEAALDTLINTSGRVVLTGGGTASAATAEVHAQGATPPLQGAPEGAAAGRGGCGHR